MPVRYIQAVAGGKERQMSKPKDKAVAVLDYFETAPLETAYTVHGLAGRALKRRLTRTEAKVPPFAPSPTFGSVGPAGGTGRRRRADAEKKAEPETVHETAVSDVGL